MLGDVDDFVARLSAVLPLNWFAEQSPNLRAALTAIATPWSWIYGNIQYVISQTRIATATDSWLDLVSLDYFGHRLTRKVGESDASFRSRIYSAILRESATRKAVIAGLYDLTGNEPRLFEPASCADTGGYGTSTSNTPIAASNLAYGHAGGWGNLSLPYQFFIDIARPPTPNVACLSGYGVSQGGFGIGTIAYLDIGQIVGQITDSEIEAAICAIVPVEAVAWLRII